MTKTFIFTAQTRSSAEVVILRQSCNFAIFFFFTMNSQFHKICKFSFKNPQFSDKKLQLNGLTI